MKKLEIAAFNFQSAIIAEESGAHRVELCKNMELGGTTPDLQTFVNLRKELEIDIYVMVRPRGGDFYYSEEEFDQMLREISVFKENGSNGFVFGILTKEEEIDVRRNSLLVAAAAPLPCTFHRAFDRCNNKEEALENVITCGFHTILTSGFAANVNEGAAQLQKLVTQAGNRITIMPGGGLRAANLPAIVSQTGAQFYHSSGIREGLVASVEEIQQMVSILNNK